MTARGLSVRAAASFSPRRATPSPTAVGEGEGAHAAKAGGEDLRARLLCSPPRGRSITTAPAVCNQHEKSQVAVARCAGGEKRRRQASGLPPSSPTGERGTGGVR